MLHGRNSYIPGRPWGICDVCGFKCRHDQLRKRWDGLMVCGPDYDPPPEELHPPRVPNDGQPIRDARPDPGDVLGDNETTAEDL